MKHLLYFTLLFSSLNAFSQSPIGKSLEQYRSDYLPEKVFVHTDKNIYTAGETIWLALYLIDGQTHTPGAFSVFARVELLDSEQKIIKHLKLFAPEGHANGSIDLDDDLLPGNYQLIAYTNYQRNSSDKVLFRKTIRVLGGIKNENTEIAPINLPTLESEGRKITLRFFPEGGDCIEGLPCTVALVAEDEAGLPIIVEGIIQTQTNEAIGFIKTNEYGMGVFSFTPKNGQTYEVLLSNQDQSFALPPPMKEGYSLSVRNVEHDFQIVTRSNLARGLKDARIVIHHRGILFLNEKLNLSKGTSVINLQRKDLGPGVHIATLFDKENQPVAERLFFVPPNEEQIHIQLDLSETSVGIRQSVNLKISTPNLEKLKDSLINARISLSVIPEVASIGIAENDIRTWILLNSDLDTPVPHTSEFIFAKNGHTNSQLINQFLMTRGWRRFRWQALNSDSFKPVYPLERGLFIKGQMTEIDAPEKPRPGKVFFAQLTGNQFEEAMTDEKGHFNFGPYLLFDTTEIILQGRYKMGKKNRLNDNISLKDNSYVKLIISEDIDPPKLISSTYQSLNSVKSGTVANRQLLDYEVISKNMLVISRNYDSLLLQMEAIDITAQRTQPTAPIDRQRKERSFMYNGNPSYRMILDSVPGANIGTNVTDLFYRLPGVTIIGGSPVIQGQGSFLADTGPLYMVDGQAVDAAYLSSLSVADIEFIDVLRGADATIYGVRGANGVILIYTRLGTVLSAYKQSGILNAKIVGFHKAREFAVFDSENPANSNRPDIRTTLHWNPMLEVNQLGSIQESFTTSDQKGKFIIIAQGLRKDGQLLFGQKTFEVK